MADILSQDEIDRLLGLDYELSDFPIYIISSKGIMEVTFDSLGVESDSIDEFDLKNILSKRFDISRENIEVFRSKLNAINAIQREYENTERLAKKYNTALKSLEKYFEEHPEYKI